MATGQSPCEAELPVDLGQQELRFVARTAGPASPTRVPNDPRNERSLRTLDAFTRAISASWSDDTVVVPARTSSRRIRWYTGRRATVASGMRRELGTTMLRGSYRGRGTGAPSRPHRDTADECSRRTSRDRRNADDALQADWSRSARRSALPTRPWGSSSTNRIDVGHL